MEKLFSGSIQSNGVKIHYQRTSADLPSVVLLHGLTNNGSCWSKLAFDLSKRYDVFLPDARGHGLSDKPAVGYSADLMARDAAELIQQLEISQPVVIGHSMGAAVTAKLAADYPDLVRSILLIDPPWIGREKMTEEALKYSEDEFRNSIAYYHGATIDELIAGLKIKFPAFPEEVYFPMAKGFQQVTLDILPIIGSIVEDWELVVEKIKCPVLLLTGNPEKGAIITPEISAMLKAKYPIWDIHYFENANHHIQWVAYDEVKRIVMDFVAKSYSSSAR